MNSAASHNESVTENAWKSLCETSNKNSRLVGHLSLHGHAWYQANASLSWICFETFSLLGKRSRKPSHHIDTWQCSLIIISNLIPSQLTRAKCSAKMSLSTLRSAQSSADWLDQSSKSWLYAQLRCKQPSKNPGPSMSSATQKKNKSAAQGSKSPELNRPRRVVGKSTAQLFLSRFLLFCLCGFLLGKISCIWY